MRGGCSRTYINAYNIFGYNESGRLILLKMLSTCSFIRAKWWLPEPPDHAYIKPAPVRANSPASPLAVIRININWERSPRMLLFVRRLRCSVHHLSWLNTLTIPKLLAILDQWGSPHRNGMSGYKKNLLWGGKGT